MTPSSPPLSPDPQPHSESCSFSPSTILQLCIYLHSSITYIPGSTSSPRKTRTDTIHSIVADSSDGPAGFPHTRTDPTKTLAVVVDLSEPKFSFSSAAEALQKAGFSVVATDAAAADAIRGMEMCGFISRSHGKRPTEERNRHFRFTERLKEETAKKARTELASSAAKQQQQQQQGKKEKPEPGPEPEPIPAEPSSLTPTTSPRSAAVSLIIPVAAAVVVSFLITLFRTYKQQESVGLAETLRNIVRNTAFIATAFEFLLGWMLATLCSRFFSPKNTEASATAAAAASFPSSAVSSAPRAMTTNPTSSAASTHDAATPAMPVSELDAALKQAKDLYDEFRFIEAGDVLVRCTKTIGISSQAGTKLDADLTPMQTESILNAASALIKSPLYVDMARRHLEAQNALAFLTSADGWKLFKTLPSGTTVFSRSNKPSELSVKVVGKIDASPMSVCATWKEGDLYQHWFPVVQYSKVFELVSPVELIFKFGGSSVLGRSESVLRGWGVDYLSKGFFLILGGTVDYDSKGNPVEPAPFMTTRNRINELSICVEPISATQTQNVMISTIDVPGLIPTWLMEWILSKVFSQIIASMETLAKATDASMEPGSGVSSAHGDRIKNDAFYKNILQPKIISFLEKRQGEQGSVEA